MDQVENGSFELQEGNESDDSAARFLYNINRQITASEVTPETSAAVPNRPYYSVTTELKKTEEAGPYLHEHENLGSASMRREAPVCLDKYGEMEPAIIKQEGIKKQLDSYIYEHLNVEPVSIRQEPTAYVDEYEKLVNESIVDRANAENKEEPAAMKAQILAKASQKLVD